MSQTYIDDKLENLIEQCISLGENSSEMPISSISSYREEVREVEKTVAKIKSYIAALEDITNETTVEHLVKKCGLDE